MATSRRLFMKNAGCAALGTTTLWNTILNLNTIKAATHFNSSVQAGGEYKALICLLLEGGSDSHNMLIPIRPDEYNLYANTRSNLAVPNFNPSEPNNTSNIQALGDINADPQYGVHPSMTNMKNLYNEGKLAFIANVGTLIEPVEKNNVWDGANLPLGLFSHIDQVAHWQTGIPQDRVKSGWGGKMSELLSDYNIQDNISMNLSFSGSNIFQTGNSTVEYALEGGYDSEGSVAFRTINWSPEYENIMTMGVNSIVDATYQDIFKKTYNRTVKLAKDGNKIFSEAYDSAFPFQTEFSYDVDPSPNNDLKLSQIFKVIAKTISIQSQLNMNRQIFFVRWGGWDHHDGLGEDFDERLRLVDQALGEFNSAMEEINMSDCVTTFSISEFGRTLTSNGNGSDHAWGGNMFVMGGAVNGGNIYGEYPTLELDGELEIGGGVLIPTTSADNYFAEIAQWFGVMNSDLPDLFPNIGAFYNINSGVPPIGFMRT